MYRFLTVYMTFLIVLTAVVLTLFFYRFSRSILFDQIDKRLYSACHFAKSSLPDDYHDRIEGPGSVGTSEYREIIKRNNRLCNRLNLQYLWSCILIDGEVVFTSATSPSKDVAQEDYAKFLERHSDPGAFDNVFTKMEVDYSSFHNQWGHGRMVLVPFRDSRGRLYCFGASMSIDEVRAASQMLLLQALVLCAAVAVLGLLGTRLLALRIARPVDELKSSARKIAEGNLEDAVAVRGPSEIEELGRAVNTMRSSLHEHISALSKSEEEHRMLLHSLSVAVIIHSPDTRIRYSNPMAEELLGLSHDKIEGKNAADSAWHFLREDETPMPPEEYPVNIVLKTRETLYEYVLGIHRPSEKATTWVLVNAFPEVNEDGTVREVVVTFADITRIKNLEKQLVEAQKMEAVGQLAGGVAHDFNNILQAISGFNELAMLTVDEGNPARESLDEVNVAVERASKLVAQLLAFSRRQVMEPAYLDMNKVTSNLIDMLKRIIGEHIRLDFIPGHRLGTVHGDQTMIEQVLLNLCVNARDAMPDGGQLTIESENIFIDNDYCAENIWARPGRYVLISVTDTGVGMDAEMLAHAFEPFFTSKEEGRGTGLGLSTVYGVVRQHDGMVRAYSEVGKGTTFKIYLPLVEREADNVGTKIEGKVSGGSETILVAEDDESLRSLATRVLESAGYTVLSAKDGEEALDVFHAHKDDIDLLLLDVIMPGMGGREMFDIARRDRPGILALFASGYSENAIHTNFVLEKGMKLIRKPYRSNDLLRRIREILDA